MMSGVAVVAVVVAVSAVSGGLFNGNGPTTALTDLGTPSPETTADAPASGSTLIAGAAPTPFDVGAGNVEWFGTDPDGKVAYNAAPIRKVCPVDSATSCATIDDSAGERLALTSAPKSIIGSPTQQQAVVVTDDGSGGQQITVLSLPAVQATPAPTATPSDSPSPTTVASPTPTASASVATDEPSAEPTASDPNATEPPPTEPPTESPTATDEPSAEPTATPDPTTEPTATPEPTETPVLSPEPTIATSLAIANDITVVGESAAFSADGRWFAFTARPTDGSAGPDIYVWHVGDETARRLTEGGHTYFASWDGGTVVASEEAPDAASPGDVVSTFIDPETGADQAAGDLWRPVVDPTAKRAVAWVGDVAPTANGMSILPTDGRLELRGWTSDDGSSSGDGSAQVVADGPIADFDVRWDESGTWFAVWIADAVRHGRRAPEPLSRRSGHRAAGAPRGRPGRCRGPPRLLDRSGSPCLGDAARPGWRRQPRPDRGLGERRSGYRRDRSR